MKRFDYRTAWYKLAVPAYIGLSSEIKDLYASVVADGDGWVQGSDCDLPLSQLTAAMLARFEAIDSETLSYAARVVYFVGHWRPSMRQPDPRVPIDAIGGSWKFALVASQVLRARLNLKRTASFNGFAFTIVNGELRRTFGSDNGWTWTDVGPATPENMARAASACGAWKFKRHDAACLHIEALKAWALENTDALTRPWLTVGTDFVEGDGQ